MNTRRTGNSISHRLSQRAWLATWIFIGTGCFFLFAHRAWFIPETDYVAYYNAGLRALTGSNLYINEQTPFKYLPVVSYFFVPLSLLPFQISKFVFFVMSFILSAAVYAGIQRRWGNWITLAVLLSMIRFHNYDFLNAQVNHLLLAFLVGYLCLRRSRLIPASLLFAITASFKVVPLLLLAPLFFMKRYREIGAIVGWFLILSIVPIVLFEDGSSIYQNWLYLLQTTTEFPAPSSPILQSVQAALWFWLKQILPDAGSFFYISYSAQIGLMGACCWFARTAHTETQQNLVIAAAIVLSIIISPLAWKHNYLLALPAFVLLLHQKKYLSVGVAFFLMTGVAALVRVFSQHWVDRSYSLLLGALVLFFSLLAATRNSASTTQAVEIDRPVGI